MANQVAAATQGLGPSPTSPPSTTTPTPLTSQARNTFKTSFDRFERTVKTYSDTDHRDFSSTTLNDVRQAARQVQQELAARQCLRNMRRLEPFLDGLEAYSKAVEIVCNGTPYVAWIWAPVKLMLKLATDYLGAFEKLIAAYGRIAENLPRFDRLSNAYKNHPDFQQVLAVVYSDILEFHRKAYKFFKKNGWKCFFSSTWGRFDARFTCILESLSRHSDLVDREANAFAIAQTIKWREEAVQAAATKTKERSAIQSTATLACLNLDNVAHCGQREQEDILDTLVSDCCPGTTEWILRHQKMKTWLKDSRNSSILWLKGKSTLCARLVQFLRADKRSTLLYCFYNYKMSGVPQHPSSVILATLVSQILRQNRNLSAYVYEEFVTASRSPSVQTLKEILGNLMPQVKSPRVVVDGIDECIRYDSSGSPKDLGVIKEAVHDILQLERLSGSTIGVKLLISSRDILQVFDTLSRKPTVALEQETEHINSAIRTFANHRLSDVRTRFDSFSDVDKILSALENKIALKSQEMFLWARLVLLQIEEDAFALNDIEAAIVDMPTSLNDFYARILSRTGPLTPSSRKRVNTILKWMICSRRPLRAVELQDALIFAGALTTLSDKTRLRATVLDLCKSLIQVLKDNTVVFVHFTVQECLVDSRFISLLDAERCVTKCCLNYMDFSFSLIDPMTNEDQRTINVGTFLYSLQSYTHEHWLDHLFAGISETSTSDALSQDLIIQLNRLILSMKRTGIPFREATVDFRPEAVDSISVFKTRLAHFEDYGEIHNLLRGMVQCRQLAKLTFGEDMVSRHQETQEHQSPLEAVNDEYQMRVNLLLSSHTITGLDPTQLATFKAAYSSYAFSCRYPDCSSGVLGFPTEEFRAQHEQIHALPLLCSQPGCTYSLPFRSMNGLKRHIREYHAVRTARIPRSVRTMSDLRKPSRPAQDTFQRPPNSSSLEPNAFLHTDTLSTSRAKKGGHESQTRRVTDNQMSDRNLFSNYDRPLSDSPTSVRWPSDDHNGGQPVYHDENISMSAAHFSTQLQEYHLGNQQPVSREAAGSQYIEQNALSHVSTPQQQPGHIVPSRTPPPFAAKDFLSGSDPQLAAYEESIKEIEIEYGRWEDIENIAHSPSIPQSQPTVTPLLSPQRAYLPSPETKDLEDYDFDDFLNPQYRQESNVGIHPSFTFDWNNTFGPSTPAWRGSDPVHCSKVVSDHGGPTPLIANNIPQAVVVEDEPALTPSSSTSKMAPYVRPQHPKLMCPRCNERPNGFRGVHELERHIGRAHITRGKGYICVDASPDGGFLANCKYCRNKKVSGACFNAAAHLRRAHIHPRERGRKSKNHKRGVLGVETILPWTI